MATILFMPEIAANTSHARLETWLVTEGDPVSAGDLLAEIETEKAMIEFAAEAEGVLYRQLVREGDDVAVGSPIAVMSAVGEEGIDLVALLGGDDRPGEALPHGTGSAEPAVPAAAEAAEAAEEPAIAERQFASPIARKRSRERGVDLTSVLGTGPQGRVTLRDVMSASENPQEPSAPLTASAPAGPALTPETSGVSYTDIPHTAMRRAIARRLTESKSSTPHFYLSSQCRVDALLELRRQANELSERRLSVTDFVIAAAAHAFVTVPDANVIWTDDALRKFSRVDISVAVATESGLLVPVLRDVASRSLSAISLAVSDVSERSRSGKMRQSELEGGCFTITNLGMFGTREFSAILNPPQSGILAVGAAHRAPVIVDDAVVPATVIDFTLSVDHRAIDGALAATWLAAFSRAIENPVITLI